MLPACEFLNSLADNIRFLLHVLLLDVSLLFKERSYVEFTKLCTLTRFKFIRGEFVQKEPGNEPR